LAFTLLTKSRRIKWARYVTAYKIFVGKPRTWEVSVKMDFREVWWEGVEWMHLAQDRDQWRALVNTVMNLRVQ
jgi:hypothetical protein